MQRMKHCKTTERAKGFAGWELKGKKLGVIGLGAIGAEVANAATHLGMEVYGYDPYISVNAAWRLSRNVKHITNVDTISRSAIISPFMCRCWSLPRA